MSAGPGTNTGHGHVWERPDGTIAKCGGPGVCTECSKDQAQWVERIAPGAVEDLQRLGQEMTNPTPEEIIAIEERHKLARQMVSDLCEGRREWIMRIPAEPDYDPDLVIAASLADIPKLIAELRAMTTKDET